jgi:phage terminase large subunit-like protein
MVTSPNQATDQAALAAALTRIDVPVAPRLWTPRDETLDTHGPLLAALLELAGLEPMEWQRLIADLACEVSADRKWAHPLVVLLVARQNGKTALLIGRILAALFAFPWDRLVLHTAQDRTVPAQTFKKLQQLIEATPALHRRIAKGGIRTTNGDEHIETKDGSKYKILAPRAEAFRFWSADVLIFDEAREQHDWNLWGAAVPTQRARPNPQRWVVSNAGDPESVVLNNMQDRGRAAAIEGGDHIAFAEYSAPDDCPIDDPAGIAAANPALGTMIGPAAILEELRTLPELRYRTEILCQRVSVSAATAIPSMPWRDAGGDPEPFDPATTRPYLGFDIDPDREEASLVAAQWADDRLVVSLVKRWPEPGEQLDEIAIVDDLQAFAHVWRPSGLGFQPATAGSIPDWLKQSATRGVKITGQDFYTACQQLFESVTNGTLMHRNEDDLSRPVLATVRREAGDGFWRLSRRDTAEPISAAMALTHAVYLAYRPAPAPFVA